MSTTIAVDAMGGDRAPDEIVAGAVQAANDLGVRVLLVGRSEVLEPLVGSGEVNVDIVHASEIVAMHESPTLVRRKKDASIVQCAQLVRSGLAEAMVSAGNTGAAMAAALLRIGRLKGIVRPAIVAPIPAPGRTGQVLVDAGATVDCAPEWLVQFAHMGRVYSRARFGIAEPTVGLLSNGGEPSKGDSLRKEAYALLGDVPGFVGNFEGSDFWRRDVDVIVTDGFTGNVALKTIEATMRATAKFVVDVLTSEAAGDASTTVLPLLLDAAAEVDPDHVGGSVLLGVEGVCVIAHGSSGALAMRNAVARAVEAVDADVVGRVKEAIGRAR